MSPSERFAAASAYVGAPAVPGEDCADFCARTLHELYGHVLRLPPAQERPHDKAARRRLIRSRSSVVAHELGGPRDGCIALMREAVAQNAAWHLGTVVQAENGQFWVLHKVSDAAGVMFQPLRAMQITVGVLGYYACA